MYRISELEVTPFRDMAHVVGSIVTQDGNVKSGFAIALNAEKIISMRKNPDVRKILEMATLRYPDGIGVVWALRKKGAECCRIPGCDLWVELMKTAGQKQTKVFLVGAKPDVMAATKAKLTCEFGVNLVGVQHGYFENEETLITQIADSGAKVITVAMGSPSQEKFIAKCRDKHPDAFYMGVGGTYDVYVGNVKRAPKWAQKSNLEWFYRAIKQPHRIFRQFIILKFLFLLISNKL